ncbi:MAG TPA: FtsW/RodA/SpoVE family cell cycle protein, partial [Bryobacteraceae bacterium]|nr:FtsW/RodA/SpoVE family cell cycle protein [Bryobacteraceae bacterium]
MAVTRSSAAERRAGHTAVAERRMGRPLELIGLVLGSVALLLGMGLAWSAKSATPAPGTLNLNAVERAEQLLPALDFIENPRQRQQTATRIFERLQEGRLPNVGGIGRIPSATGRGRLLNGEQVAALKKLSVVRTMTDFRRAFVLWVALFFAAFYALHAFWRFRGFTGEQLILPAIHLLTGTGLILMISMRDPLRDTLSFVDYSQSVALGTLAMALASQLDYERLFGRLSYVPLLGAVALSAALIGFGSGPGTSDAKVNLLGFQPVEAIKVLIAFFLAGYFARRWEFLRVLRERRPELAQVSKYVEIPRLEYLLPVLAGVGLTLVFFFLQKDLGPALVISCVFLALYAVARSRAVLAVSGLATLIGGFLLGYFIQYPRTVHDRVEMWLSPWDNAVRGGEQVVHSLWAFATGGPFGTGLGLGDPGIMPAAHTDLILAVLGEEWGFVGVLAIGVLYTVLIWIGLRIALRAATDYAIFLALGLTLLTAFSMLLITGGVLDLLPLSGVAMPFLSYGGTAMLANFAIFGILLALSIKQGDIEQARPFRVPITRIAQALAAIGIVMIGRAAWFQVVRADATAGAGVLTVQADGYRRYNYNPRLLAIAASIPRGTIFDRNGLPLAASDPAVIAKHRDTYARLGLSTTPRTEEGDRIYPLGPLAIHVIGDLNTRTNWGARNSSLVERDSIVRLQGFNDRAVVVEVPHPVTGKKTWTVRRDFRELLPLLRHRQQPQHPDVLKVLNRPRDVRTSIDARLQVRAARLLEAGLKRVGRNRGAALVLHPKTGDLLASVSYPWPTDMPAATGPDDGIDEMLDRARYGLYPPGSTFKIVTAMAALRKDPLLAQATFDCRPLPDGRVGNTVRGWGRPIRDDVQDKVAHGAVAMREGTVVSCNAYYAQLGTYRVGADALKTVADLLGIGTGNLKDALPQAAYGQGQVVASPFQMARAAAVVANSGHMPYGRWVIDESNARVAQPVQILDAAPARLLAEYMRGVVTSGT